MTLAEASALLGVSPATLRRWADAGRVSVFTTPGGHRRFSRRGLRRLLPSSRLRRPAAERLGLTPDRLSRIYRRRGQTFALQTPWLADLDEQDRERFRMRGRRLAVHLLAWLDAEVGGGADPEVADHPLHEASQAAAEYGRESADRGWSLSQTVEGFLQFRSPFMSELMRGARRRGLDAASATAMVESAEGAMDRLLLATMTGHSVAQVGRLSGRRRASGIEGAVD
jgi:excisionase family DNA binding protein